MWGDALDVGKPFMALLVNRKGWLDKDFVIHASLSNLGKRVRWARNRADTEE